MQHLAKYVKDIKKQNESMSLRTLFLKRLQFSLSVYLNWLDII